MAGSDEAPEKTQKRAERHNHLLGGRQHKRPRTTWRNSIGRLAGDQTKDRLSQSAFAASSGVPEGTLVNWEQGRRQPSGAAKVLLALLAKKPNLVMELYPLAQPRVRWAPGCPDPNTMTAEERLADVGQILAIGILRMRTNPSRQARSHEVQSSQADRKEAANESIRSAISRSPKTTL